MRKKNITSEMMMGYIAESLLVLMRTKRYEDISIGEIAEKASVNRSTYYRHFKTKDDIVRWYLDGIMQEYQDEFAKTAQKGISDYLLVMFRTFYAHKDDLVRIHKAGLSSCLLAVLSDRFQFARIAESTDTAEQFRLAYHLGGIYNNMLLWFSHGLLETPEEMTQIALSLHLDEARTLFARS